MAEAGRKRWKIENEGFKPPEELAGGHHPMHAAGMTSHRRTII